MSLRTVTVPALEAIPGLVHGFERRPAAGSRESREATRSRVADSVAPYGQLQLMTQVHGAAVIEAPWQGTPAADGAVCSTAGRLLGIETADCLPILLADPAHRLVATAHAGWRGTAARIAEAAVHAAIECGSRAADLIAALGPAIGPCCYEVGAELRGAFRDEALAVFRTGPGGRPHLDLRQTNVRQLLQAGLSPKNIFHVDECTACRPGEYYSYRRDGKGSGRMISFIGFALEPCAAGVSRSARS